jgi:hypothetical protein
MDAIAVRIENQEMPRRNGRKRFRKPAEASLRSSRNTEPVDWVAYLEPVASELPVALEILRRLRWAFALKERGLSEAPQPTGRYRRMAPTRTANESSGRGIPRARDFGFVHEADDVVALLLSPEEMVATIDLATLRGQLDLWEAEVRAWGKAIWTKRGDELRLRRQRSDLRRQIDWLKLLEGEPITDAKAARVINDADSHPGEIQAIGPNSRYSRILSPCDEFGNDSDEALDAETLSDAAEKQFEDRELRRVYKGESKKGRGGVLQIERLLLKSPKSPPDSTD